MSIKKQHFLSNMNELFGGKPPTYESFCTVRETWDSISDLDYSFSKIYEREYFEEFNPLIERYSGGKNGNLIARYIHDWVDDSTHRVITVHDYKMNILYYYRINYSCDDIFFYMTPDDHLVVLTNRGDLVIFFAGRLTKHTQLTTRKILKADFWENGLIFLNEDNEVHYAPFFENPRLLNNLECKEKGFVKELKVIPAEYTEKQQPIVVITFDEEYSITVLSDDFCTDIDVIEPIQTFSFSPNFTFIAFLTTSNTLIIADSSFSREPYLSVSLPINNDQFIGNMQVAWMGNHVPVISDSKDVIICTSEGECCVVGNVNYNMTGYPVLFTSDDCLLFVTNESLFKLSYVPHSIYNASILTKDKPSSRLVIAFDKRSSSEVLKLKEEGVLQNAIEECINASLEVDEADNQKILLLSAVFGRSYIPEMDSSELSNISQIIRISNSFKTELNTFVTPIQIKDFLQQSDIIMRICGRNRYSLAMKIAGYLGINQQEILTQWACSVANKFNDDDAYNIIQKKIEPSFNFTSIATELFSEGRFDLSIKIANLEMNPARVVPFYVSAGLWQDAINAAVRSSDSSSFIDVINQAIENNQDDNLIGSAIASDSVSFSTISKLTGKRTDKKLAQILASTPLSIQSCETVVRNIIRKLIESGTKEDVLQWYRKIEEISEYFNNKEPWIRNLVTLAKYHVLFTENIKDNLKVMIPINKVLEKMILNKEYQKAEEFANSMKMEKERYNLLLAKTLSKNDKWDDFKMLVDVKYKSSYSNFVSICLFKWGKNKALEFVQHLQDQKSITEFSEMLEKEQPQSSFFNNGNVQFFKNKLF